MGMNNIAMGCKPHSVHPYSCFGSIRGKTNLPFSSHTPVSQGLEGLSVRKQDLGAAHRAARVAMCSNFNSRTGIVFYPGSVSHEAPGTLNKVSAAAIIIKIFHITYLPPDIKSLTFKAAYSRFRYPC